MGFTDKILVLLGLAEVQGDGALCWWNMVFVCSLRGELAVVKCEGLPLLSPQAALF